MRISGFINWPSPLPGPRMHSSAYPNKGVSRLHLPNRRVSSGFAEVPPPSPKQLSGLQDISHAIFRLTRRSEPLKLSSLASSTKPQVLFLNSRCLSTRHYSKFVADLDVTRASSSPLLLLLLDPEFPLFPFRVQSVATPTNTRCNPQLHEVLQSHPRLQTRPRQARQHHTAMRAQTAPERSVNVSIVMLEEPARGEYLVQIYCSCCSETLASW